MKGTLIYVHILCNKQIYNIVVSYVIGNVPACCRGGVRFKAEPHCVIIEALIMLLCREYDINSKNKVN